jgi:hypothetical protein
MLLNEPKQHRKQDDDRDDDGFESVTEESRYRGGGEKNENEHVLELCREGSPCRRARRRLQLVRAVRGESPRRLSARKTSRCRR